MDISSASFQTCSSINIRVLSRVLLPYHRARDGYDYSGAWTEDTKANVSSNKSIPTSVSGTIAGGYHEHEIFNFVPFTLK